MYGSRKKEKSGFACVLALVLLAVFAALAVSFTCASSIVVAKADGTANTQQARLESESGLAFYSRLLQKAGVQGNLTGTAMMADLFASIKANIGPANVNVAAITYDGADTIVIPNIATDSVGRFSARIVRFDDTNVTVTVTGSRAGAARACQLRMLLSPGATSVLNYGVASRGKIALTGNANISGKNNRAEAAVLTTTYSDLDAVDMNGNCSIGGDLSVSNPAAHVSMTGNVSVAGFAQGNSQINNHIHIGVGDVEFPQADPSVFAPFATNIVDSHTSTTGNKTFTNIRIKAGTNPTFSGNITIKGIVYVEMPNKVNFTGNLNLTGMVVTDDATDANDLSQNYIRFSGNTSTAGVDALPSTSDFAGLKALPGTFLLAPGFSVSFTGNFGTINGSMAANEFKWTGNAGGTVHGSIINWGDTLFSMTGNSNLVFDHSNLPTNLPGLTGRGKLAPVASTFTEVTP